MPKKPHVSAVIPPAAIPQVRVMRHCYVHQRETEHWRRSDDLICNQCHPDPSELPALVRVPSAKECQPEPTELKKVGRVPSKKELGFTA